MKKHFFLTPLFAFCLAVTACGDKDSSAAKDSSSAADTTVTTTETTGTEANGAETTETTTATASAEQTTSVSASEQTEPQEGTTVKPASDPGTVGKKIFATPEEALKNTYDMWNARNSEGILNAVPERLAKDIADDYEIEYSDLKKALDKMFADNGDSDQKIELTIKGRVKPEEVMEGDKLTEFNTYRDNILNELSETYGYEKSSLEWVALDVHAVMTEDGETEEADDYCAVFLLDEGWFDPTAASVLADAAWSFNEG